MFRICAAVVSGLLAVVVACGIGAAAELDVLDSTTARTLLHEHLLGEVARQYAARRGAVERALASPDAMLARREQLRAQFRELLGEFPERTPLGARTVGAIRCPGYRIEKVVYESRPGHHVTANLYLPESDARVPGVLVPCGHSDNGKASEAYQSVCVLLARNGCAALIYDPIGQGERNQLRGIARHGTTEHTLVGIGALAVGWNTGHYRVWDGLRGMDYLASRPEIAPSRLGCTGNSGGGTMTTWLMAVDERILAAAPSCFITTVERLFATIGPQDCEQHFPRQGELGIEHADFITMRAPKPTLILAAERDFFDFSGTRQAHAEAAAVYRLLGHPESLELFSYDDEHGFSRPRREAAVHWMRRWLADDNRPVREPELILQSDAALQVTLKGQVIDEFEGEITVVDLAQRRADELAEQRKTAWAGMDNRQRTATISKVIGLSREPSARPKVAPRGTLARSGYAIERLAIEREGRVPLAGLLFVPDSAAKSGKSPGVVYVDARGKAAAAEGGGPIEALVRQGRVVLALDLRGYGETADAAGQSKYLNDEFRVAMLAMHVGQPLLGQRVEDLLAGLEVLSRDTRVDAEAIELVGVGGAAPVALHAAAIEPRFRTVRLAIRFALGPTTSCDGRGRPI